MQPNINRHSKQPSAPVFAWCTHSTLPCCQCQRILVGMPRTLRCAVRGWSLRSAVVCRWRVPAAAVAAAKGTRACRMQRAGGRMSVAECVPSTPQACQWRASFRPCQPAWRCARTSMDRRGAAVQQSDHSPAEQQPCGGQQPLSKRRVPLLRCARWCPAGGKQSHLQRPRRDIAGAPLLGAHCPGRVYCRYCGRHLPRRWDRGGVSLADEESCPQPNADSSAGHFVRVHAHAAWVGGAAPYRR